MATNGFSSWILHRNWSGETSARVVFFTREAGLKQCVCKGGRTPKKQALLQPFMPIWFIANRHYVQRIENQSEALQLKGDALFSGLYLNELLNHALEPDEPYPELFDAYSEAIHLLQKADSRMQLEAILRRFEWTLLNTLGYGLILTHDASTSIAIHPESYYQLVLGHGLVKAETGFLGAHLLALSKNNLEDIPILKTAKNLMRMVIHHLLDGVEIQARKLYSSGFTLS
jgi:DNA repair protein RecO (recombination protein O)